MILTPDMQLVSVYFPQKDAFTHRPVLILIGVLTFAYIGGLCLSRHL